MARVVVIGEQVRVAGYALAGAIVVAADDDDAVRDAWAGLPGDVDVVLLSPAAADALGARRTSSLRPLTVVMPS